MVAGVGGCESHSKPEVRGALPGVRFRRKCRRGAKGCGFVGDGERVNRLNEDWGERGGDCWSKDGWRRRCGGYRRVRHDIDSRCGMWRWVFDSQSIHRNTLFVFKSFCEEWRICDIDVHVYANSERTEKSDGCVFYILLALPQQVPSLERCTRTHGDQPKRAMGKVNTNSFFIRSR